MFSTYLRCFCIGLSSYGLIAREAAPLTQYLGTPLTLSEASGVSAKAGWGVKWAGRLTMNNSLQEEREDVPMTAAQV